MLVNANAVLPSQEVRALVPDLSRRGKTVLLITHYVLEADVLCDRVALIDHGTLVAEGTPSEIKRQVSVIELQVLEASPEVVTALRGLAGVERIEQGQSGLLQRLVIYVTSGMDLRSAIVQIVGQEAIESVVEREPTLEEAYVKILST